MLYSEERIDDAVTDVLLATQRMRTSAFGFPLYVYLQIMKLMFSFDSVGKQMEIFLLKPQIAMHIRMLDNLGHGTVKSIGLNAKTSILMMPPLDAGEKFGEIYDVVLILDDREHFTRSKNGKVFSVYVFIGTILRVSVIKVEAKLVPQSLTSALSRFKKFMKSIETEFKIQIEVRRLEVGDELWIAKHKYTGSEYVLDFIVERKHVDDLFSLIKDSRYRDQKLRLTDYPDVALASVGCMPLARRARDDDWYTPTARMWTSEINIYIVEGDPNSHEAGETIKTACFTPEILEGFDVQITSGLGNTLRKYGYLTHAITNYYEAHITNDEMRNTKICPSYKNFLKKCQDIDKMTVSDVFAVQLMQVSQVTEEIALSVLELYPTLLSLARAYSLLATSGLGAAAAYALSGEGIYVVLAGRSTHLLSEKQFIKTYAHNRDKEENLYTLIGLKQLHGEKLEDFSKKFLELARKVDNLDQKTAVTAFTNALRFNCKAKKYIFLNKPTKLEEMITKVNSYVDLKRMMSERQKSTKSVLSTKSPPAEQTSEPKEEQGDHKRTKGNTEYPRRSGP
ncbi:hypothetical protein GIB67_001371 [Kingdonia uniflora]|uniref:Crossover junction endonuclease MUS81 n=1 Tax=Kingdonia uniflora TaxID=39325 RepID=A0A7J7NMX0_9MAGN|nr:hypothetical protein GIB67_001371 [Kingdonia uniflora]